MKKEIFAFVAWVDKNSGEPQIYFTRDEVVAHQALVRAKAASKERALSKVRKEWPLYRHLFVPTQ